MMDETAIPHAVGETVVKGFPRSTLHVATKLAQNYGQAGFDANAKVTLEKAALARQIELGLDEYKIHWSHHA